MHQMPVDESKQEQLPYDYKLRPCTSATGNTKSEFVLSCDFDQLAALYPEEFATAHIQNKSSSQSAFNPSSEFNKSLTRCLLRHHFSLQLPSLPEGRLCPPIPNRANYVCWLRELILSSESDLERFSCQRTYDLCVGEKQECDMRKEKASLQCQGIDIGTGVSCIYPLLLSTELFVKSDALSEMYPESSRHTDKHASKIDDNQKTKNQWKFLATDIDPIAISSAVKNVSANNLDHEIHVVQVSSSNANNCQFTNASHNTIIDRHEGPLYAAMLEARRNAAFKVPHSSEYNDTGNLSTYPKFDFIMTNPPFYSTTEEATSLRAGDKRPRTDMSSNEAVYKQSYSHAFDYDHSTNNTAIEGGDIGFIKDIIRDSQFFRHHITWYTSLVAKRSSLDRILEQLQTLDGIWGNKGQIRTVEFRQGSNSSSHPGHNAEQDDTMRCSPRVRWGIAWTYERAVMRCSSCRISNGLTHFSVSLHQEDISSYGQETDSGHENKNFRDDVYCDEIISRLETYFNSFRTVPLKCARQIKNGVHCVTVTEQLSLSCSAKRDDNNDNLPYDGHFIIDAAARVIKYDNKDQSDQYRAEMEVNLEIYSHTKRGHLLIDKIRSPMPGEIGRTNRRWRRLKSHSLHTT